MSSCFATTFKSSERPLSRVGGVCPVSAVGVSCAIAAPAERSAAAKGGIMETRTVSGRIGCVIEFLALKARRGEAAALGQVDKADFRREEERGNERERRIEREPGPSRPLRAAAEQGRAKGPGRHGPKRHCDG